MIGILKFRKIRKGGIFSLRKVNIVSKSTKNKYSKKNNNPSGLNSACSHSLSVAEPTVLRESHTGTEFTGRGLSMVGKYFEVPQNSVRRS